LKELLLPISEKIAFISDHQRFVLHLAAVFSNNFTNYLFSISANILEQGDLDFDLLRPLIEETVAKIKENDPRVMQTGPARRKDVKTLEKHLEYLEGNKLYKKIYKRLSKALMKEG